MPGPAKKATKRKPAKKRAAPKMLSASHKKALAEGRDLSSKVDRYLRAINTPKRRGRKVSKADLTKRLAAAKAASRTAVGVDKVLAAQEVRDLQKRITDLSSTNGDIDVKSLEGAFISAGKQFGENRGITYGAWREAGVPAVVLAKAGIARTRG